MSENSADKAKPPRGTPPKGGTRFPRYGLKEAIEWAKKLVSKTHNGAQSSDIIYASVVDSKGPRGEIKASALKQYNLMDGTRSAYKATPLAKSIAVAPDKESAPLLVQAVLFPTLFKSLFDTFHGDAVTTAKLRQRAAELNVHPDNLDAAVAVYSSSLAFAGLASIDGDKVIHKPAATVNAVILPAEENAAEQSEEGNEVLEDEVADEQSTDAGIRSPRAIFHVNISLDASLDSEKLAKHLALLKKYGAI